MKNYYFYSVLKKLATYTMVFSLAAIFLMSFTGIRMLIHHCLSCDTTDVFLFANAGRSCDDIHHNHHENAVCHIDIHADEPLSCCAGDDEHDHDSCVNCCKTEIHYLVNEYEVYQERSEQRIEPVVLAVFLNLFLSIDDDDITAVSSPFFNDNPDPPKPVGRDFVIYAHQLKIS